MARKSKAFIFGSKGLKLPGAVSACGYGKLDFALGAFSSCTYSPKDSLNALP